MLKNRFKAVLETLRENPGNAPAVAECCSR